MFMVVNDYDRLHANFEIERNFLYCFKRLKDVICNGGKVRDIFFRKLDMLRIKNPVIKDIVKTIVSQIYYSLKGGETKVNEQNLFQTSISHSHSRLSLDRRLLNLVTRACYAHANTRTCQGTCPRVTNTAS